MKIGVFDSGLGGLTILNAIRELLPEYDYIYYGDTKNLPYGDKSEEEILKLTKSALGKLFETDAALVVIACNTASAQTLRTLQDTMLVSSYAERRVLGVIIPTVEELVALKVKRVLLIGTTRTIESGKYELELHKRDKEGSINITAHATSKLVPLIESNNMREAEACIDTLLTPLVGEVDTVVLGCTHYTVLKKHIRTHFKTLKVLSQDEIIPEKLVAYLERHPELEKKLSRNYTLEKVLTGK